MSKHASEDLAELALAVYVEELVTHKRVLYVGDPSSPAPERLAGSARSVDVVSTRSRVRGTRRGGRVASRRWPGPEDEARWDVVIVPDLAGAGLGEAAKVAELARWVAQGGVVVAGTPDPQSAGGSALAYEELFDLLDGTFAHVRMLGQAPFVGFSVVDFAPPGELEVTFDGSILEGAGESAQRYYALCGDRDVVLDAYAVVQVPSRALADADVEAAAARGRDERASELAERLREQQDALDAVNVHAEEIEHELEGARAEIDHARREAARARDEAGAVERERVSLETRVRALEEELEAFSRAEAEAKADATADAKADAKAEATADDGAAEYAALEASLHERGRELVELRLEVARRGTLVRDLVEELRELERAGVASMAFAPTAPPPAAVPSVASAFPSVPVAPSVPVGDVQAQLEAVHAQLDHAVARAVESEAEKAQLGFRLDEVRGELAVSERRFAQELEEMRRLEAALRGTVRGLNARLGEVIELHQLTQARLALAEDDRTAAEARSRRLVRELAEAREQLELEIARTSVTDTARDAASATSEDPREAAARESQLRDALAQATERAAELESWQTQARPELEQARTALEELDQRLQTMRAGYEARVAELVNELHQVSTEAERALTQAGELRALAAAHEASEAGLRGELTGLRLRLADRELAVEELRAAARRDEVATEPPAAEPPAEPPTPGIADSLELEQARRELAELRSDLDLLADARRELEAALDEERARAAALAGQREADRAQIDELTASIEAARRHATVAYAADTSHEARLDELTAMVEARDGLAAGLQRELADAAERRTRLEEQLDECTAQLTRAREDLDTARAVAAVDAEETHRELDEIRERLDQSDVERDRALVALEEARAILHQLMGDIPTRREGAFPGGDAGGARQLREQVARLDAEAADREVLLRSLTAQLEERDDRIRALERLSDSGEPTDDARALQQKVLEMEERVARLQEELEHERSRRRLDHPS